MLPDSPDDDQVTSAAFPLLDSIQSQIAALRTLLVSDATGEAAAGDDRASPRVGLSARERQVLTLLLDGASSGDIARSLDVAPRTVDTHVRAIVAKLDGAAGSEAGVDTPATPPPDGEDDEDDDPEPSEPQ